MDAGTGDGVHKWIDGKTYVAPKDVWKVAYIGDFGTTSKVGISIDPLKRLETLSRQSGKTLIKFYVLDGPAYNARGVEGEILQQLSLKRENGEWIKLKASVVIAKFPAIIATRHPFKGPVPGTDEFRRHEQELEARQRATMKRMRVPGWRDL